MTLKKRQRGHMGQGNTGVAMRSGAETTLRYLEAKRKNRKTLTLKKSHKEQNHFEPTADFTDSGAMSNGSVNSDKLSDSPFSNVVPILTSAVMPVTTGPVTAGIAAQSVLANDIPVLDNPVALPKGEPRQKNVLLIATVFLTVIALGMLVFGGNDQQQNVTDTLSATSIEVSDLDTTLGAESAITHAAETASTAEAGLTTTNNTVATTKKIDIALVKNIVDLIQKEEFTRDTTLEAFLSVWHEANASTRATLNSTPWFLRFVFSLQKRAKQYLLSPDSYHADFNIKFNALLNLAVALDVMDQQGIQSSVQTYHTKQNQLVEQLKSEIATIERSTRKQEPTGESIADLNKEFRERYAVKSRNVVTEKQKVYKKAAAKVTAPKIVANKTAALETSVEKLPEPTKAASEKTITAIELDSIVTRFTAAYEHGDLKILMSLFSPTAKTNDKANWHGIREDYEKLFAASSFRLLNIVNLNWSASHNSMKGTGDYEIAIAMDEAGNARTLHGKIQFVIGKVDNELRITRLYHLER